MKQLKLARAKTQRYFLITIALIITLMCFGSTTSFKAGAKATGATSAVFMLPGMAGMKFKAEDDGGGESKEVVLAEVKKTAKEQVEILLKDFPKAEKITDIETKLKDIQSAVEKAQTPEAAQKLIDEITKQGLEINALKGQINTGGKDKIISIKEALEKNKSKIDAFLGQKSGVLQLNDIVTKATETSTDIDGRSAFFTWHQGGAVGLLPVRKPIIRELLTNVSTGTEYINYLDQETIIRDAKNVALCGATSHNTKVTFKVRNLQIQKTRDFVDVCLDMMNDYTFVESQIRLLIEQSLALKIDNNLLFGDSGVGINGIQQIASTFNPANADPQANYADSIDWANLIDLMAVAGLQIEAFGKNNMYSPNLILMNPRDFAKIMFYKDTIHNYQKTPMLNGNLYTGATLNIDMGGNARINGMLVRTNPNIAINTAYVMDSTKAFVYSKPGVGIEFAYENRDNFEKEVVTIKAYERMNLLVRQVDKNAFLFLSDLASDLAGIDSKKA